MCVMAEYNIFITSPTIYMENSVIPNPAAKHGDYCIFICSR